ncbi:MAG: hypothetical protein ACLTBQ_09135 [Thomasclavelia sp.]|uniref:hypothetical protein n=1 Tax=Thomasclavelia sp. TaxID=3025757 RepID=UPI00263642FB|nr:hypothetical protein [Thomasclavelia sp.]
MSFQEKYQEYKQRKEAKAFFNQNNAEKVLGKDYLMAFLIGTGVSIVLGFIMETIIYKTGINFSYIAFLVGVLEAAAIKKFLNKSGTNLAIIAVISYILGVLIAQTLYLTMLMPLVNGQLFITVFITCFKNLFIGDLLGTIIFLFGAVAAYMTLRD